MKKPKKIFVISGDIHNSTPDITHAILSGLDAEAAHRLIATAHLLYQNTEIEHTYSSKSINFPVHYYKENLIIVGGPVNNNCSHDFLKRYSSIVIFIDDKNKDYYEVSFNNKIYTPSSTLDYGVIIRDANPMNIFNKKKDILLIAGCDSYGGLAAAKILDYYKDDTLNSLHKIYRKIIFHPFKKKNFAVLVKCEILGNTVTNISIVDFKFIEQSDHYMETNE